MIFEQLTEMKGFTHQEQAVARYILEHTEAILPMSAEELAKASYTNKATVIRLSKKLGLAGYQELKFQIVSESVQNIRINQLLQNEPINEKSTYQDVLNVIPALYDKVISDTRMCMDKNVINRIFNRMMRADQIDFCGYLEGGKGLGTVDVIPWGENRRAVMESIMDYHTLPEDSFYPSHGATDMYHHWKEDIRYMAEMGFKCYRFSM